MKLGKIPIERTEIAALNERLGAASKHDRAKSVPLGLVEYRFARRQLVGELGEHRLDWWRYGKGRIDVSHVFASENGQPAWPVRAII
jgi:hypothetical protein